jgi:regulator of sigma E protease
MDKPLGTRVGVIAAGPVSNLVLGFVLMFAMYLLFGVKYLCPVIETGDSSPAATAGLRTGDLIVSAAGETIPSFERFEVIAERNQGGRIPVVVRRDGQRLEFDYSVPADSPDIEPMLPPVIDRVRTGSPAARLGLRPGDRILAVAGQNVNRWEDFVGAVMEHGGTRIPISWSRNGTTMTDSVTPSVEKDQMSDQRFGQIGVWVRLPKRALPPHVAAWEAVRRSGYIVVQTFSILWKVVTGRISTRAIGGPIMVAKVAYEGATWGPEYFLALWALLSINLFVVNMLPIPVMDGGRILLDLFGAVRRRRLTEKEMTWAGNIGWALIGLLIAFTIFNDVLRLIRR